MAVRCAALSSAKLVTSVAVQPRTLPTKYPPLASPNERDAQLRGHAAPPRLDAHVIALADVVDVHRDGGVWGQGLRGRPGGGEVVGRQRKTGVCSTKRHGRWHACLGSTCTSLPAQQQGSSRAARSPPSPPVPMPCFSISPISSASVR